MHANRFRPALEPLEARLVPAVSYHGGAVLANVEIVPVYLGRDWASTANFQELAALNSYLAFLVEGPYFDMLGEYGVGHAASWRARE